MSVGVCRGCIKGSKPTTRVGVVSETTSTDSEKLSPPSCKCSHCVINCGINQYITIVDKNQPHSQTYLLCLIQGHENDGVLEHRTNDYGMCLHTVLLLDQQTA